MVSKFQFEVHTSKQKYVNIMLLITFLSGEIHNYCESQFYFTKFFYLRLSRFRRGPCKEIQSAASTLQTASPAGHL